MAFNVKHLVLVLSAMLCIAILAAAIFFIYHPFWSGGMNNVDPEMARIAKLQLEKQAIDFWEWRLQDDPEFATAASVHTYNDKLEDQSLQAHDARFKRCKQFVNDLSQASYCSTQQTFLGLSRV